MRALFDTNIVIDDLKGDIRARNELLAADEAFVSRIVWMELLVGAGPQNLHSLQKELQSFTLLELTPVVAARTVQVRQEYRRLKLPDAIIYATALEHGLTLVTRNTRDFNETMPHVRIPYAD